MKRIFKNNLFKIGGDNLHSFVALRALMVGLVLVMAGLNACKKEMEPEAGSDVNKGNLGVIDRDGNELSAEDQRRVDFAKIFAKALSNADFRSYMKSKYELLDQQDKEFVYTLYRNDLVSGTQTLKQLLASYADAAFFTAYGNNFFDESVITDPLLTIDFVDNDNFDLTDWTSSTIPKVGVVTKKLVSISNAEDGYPGFNSSGAFVRFDDKNDPVDVSLWVKTSETLIALTPDTYTTMEGKPLETLLPGLFDKDGNPEFDVCQDLLNQIANIEQSYVGVSSSLWEPWVLVDYNDLLREYATKCETTGGGGNTCTLPCERDCDETEETLKKFRITGWSAYQFIDNQRHERWFQFRCLVPITNIITKETKVFNYITTRRKKGGILFCPGSLPCSGKWIEINHRVWPNDWKTGELGSVMEYLWLEDDTKGMTVSYSASIGFTPKFTIELPGGTKVDISLGGITGIQSSTTTTPAIVVLGSELVGYCDKLNRTYSNAMYQMVVGD